MKWDISQCVSEMGCMYGNLTEMELWKINQIYRCKLLIGDFIQPSSYTVHTFSNSPTQTHCKSVWQLLCLIHVSNPYLFHCSSNNLILIIPLFWCSHYHTTPHHTTHPSSSGYTVSNIMKAITPPSLYLHNYNTEQTHFFTVISHILGEDTLTNTQQPIS
jgi:hypothetical protein